MPNARPTGTADRHPTMTFAVDLPMDDFVALTLKAQRLRDTSVQGGGSWQQWDRILGALLEAGEAHS